MKAIICEMCGSQDVIKQNGIYVCQNCRTKYDPEEAKKLIVEVKINQSEKINNWIILARQAKENNDCESAVKYYELILQEDPNDWEANFYSVYFRAMQTKIAHIESAANLVKNTLPNVFSILSEKVDDEDTVKNSVIEIYTRIKSFGLILESSARETYKSAVESGSSYFTERTIEYIKRNVAIRHMFHTAGLCIEYYFGKKPELIALAVDLWKTSVQMVADYFYMLDNATEETEEINKVCRKIQEYVPSYSFPAPKLAGFPASVVYIINSRLKKKGLITRTPKKKTKVRLSRKKRFLIVYVALIIVLLISVSVTIKNIKLQNKVKPAVENWAENNNISKLNYSVENYYLNMDGPYYITIVWDEFEQLTPEQMYKVVKSWDSSYSDEVDYNLKRIISNGNEYMTYYDGVYSVSRGWICRFSDYSYSNSSSLYNSSNQSSSSSSSSSKTAICNYCHGTGKVNGEKCPWCNGSGKTYDNIFNDLLGDN